MVILGVNGIPTPDLKTFIRTVRDFKDGDQIYIQVQDRWRTQSLTQARQLRLDLKFYPLRVFDWSPGKLEWLPRS